MIGCNYLDSDRFHPATRVEPSFDDFAQMLKISRAREYECKEPLLLIGGASALEGQRIFRVWVCPAGESALEFIKTETEPPAPGESGGSS